MATALKHGRCTDCKTRQSTEWNCLNEDELALVDHAKSTRSRKIGENLFRQGDECKGVYCIQSGLVGLRRVDSDGNSILVRLVNPGETVGYQAFLSRSRHNVTAEILMPGEVCIINSQAIRNLLEKNPSLGLRFLDHSLRDLEATENRQMETATWNVRTRLLHTLLVLYERYGHETGDGAHMVKIPLSRQDMAELIGVTPETMSRSIKSIQNEGLVLVQGRNVRIHDLDRILDSVPELQ